VRATPIATLLQSRRSLATARGIRLRTGPNLMWMLESTPGPDPLVFRLLPGSIKTVGRAPRADFVVDAPLVSRLHCRLTLQDNGVLVEDLDSTNGTFVNGSRVRKGLLASGDVLRVGRMEFAVRKA
jgi:hypothetical protein